MRALVAGTAGHVDHGKTALVRALTGVETDRWEEERDRGLTIDLGFAPIDLGPDVDAAVVDVPGHEDFVTNMLAGATGIDLVLLVVAADEGPMPQTREHLTIASMLGVEEGIVALSKVDRVEQDWLELAVEAVREELWTVLGHARWPIVPVSAIEGVGLDALREALRERADALRPRPEDDLFRLPVDRAFTVRGAGTVVTGTAWSGSVAVGDELRVLPGDVRVRVRGLQEHGTDRERVGAGRRCALALAGPDPDEVGRGTTLAAGDGWSARERIGAILRVPTHAPRAIEPGQRVRIYLGTREVMARIDLPGGALGPGASGPARLRLEDPLVARCGDRFVVRFYSPVVTIGGGRVTELSPGAGWEERTGAWEGLLADQPAVRLATAVELSGGRGLRRAEAAVEAGVRLPTVERAGDRPPEGCVSAGDRWFSERTEARLGDRLLETLGRLHRQDRRSPTASLEELRRRAASDGFAEPLVERVVERLAAEGAVVIEGPGVRLPDHEPKLSERERASLERMVAGVEEAGLEPPTADDLAGEFELDERLLHDLLDLAVDAGRLVRVNAEIYLAPQAEAEVVATGEEVVQHGEPAPASEFKEALGVTRKYLIPYLQYLDRRGITRRTPEGRVRGSAQST